MDSASERIKLGQKRARAGEKNIERSPALTIEHVEQCRRAAEEVAELRHTARVVTGWNFENGHPNPLCSVIFSLKLPYNIA